MNLREVNALPEHITRGIQDSVTAHDLILLDLRRRGQHSTSVLEIIVDNTERGVTLDELTQLSRQINEFLDAASEEIRGGYRLEISTPGLDRPLEYEWQYRKNIGRLVKLRYSTEEQPDQKQVFRLLAVEPGVLRLSTVNNKKRKHPAEDDSILLPLTAIREAVVEPEF